MVLQVCAAGLLLTAGRFPALRPIGLAALWLVVLLALLSAALYFSEFWRKLNACLRERSGSLLILRPERKQGEGKDVAAN